MDAAAVITVTPRDWYVYGSDIYLFVLDEKKDQIIIRLADFNAYYSNSNRRFKNAVESVLQPRIKWLAIPSSESHRRPRYWQEDHSNKLLIIFKLAQIKPYQPITIANTIDPGDGYVYASPDQISQNVEDEQEVRNYGATMFFDIEVYTPDRNFPDPEYLEFSTISHISIIFSQEKSVKGYVLSLRDYDRTLPLKFDVRDVEILVIESEKELIEKFYSLWRNAVPLPTSIVSHNGYDFDIPFLVAKSLHYDLDISTLGFLEYEENNLVRQIRFSSAGVTGKTKRKPTWLLPGVKNIDTLHYFRRFHPYLSNYTLDTVAKEFLDYGKTGLSIDRMHEIIDTDDRVGMRDVIEYSFVDTYLLYLLEKKLDIITNVLTTADNLRVTAEQLLMFNTTKLCKYLIYNFDHAVLWKPIELKKPGFFQDLRTGVYHDFKVYNYDSKVLTAIISSSSCDVLEFIEEGRVSIGMSYCANLYRRLTNAPQGLALKILFSNYGTETGRTFLIESLENLMEEIEVGVDATSIYTTETLDYPLAKRENLRFLIDNNNYSVLNDAGTFTHHGRGAVTRPLFPLMKDYLEAYYKSFLKGVISILEPTIFEDEIPLLVIKVKKKHDVRTWKLVSCIRVMIPEEDCREIKSGEEKDEGKGDCCYPPKDEIDLYWYRLEMLKTTRACLTMFKNVV
jgi:hypothetical protein